MTSYRKHSPGLNLQEEASLVAMIFFYLVLVHVLIRLFFLDALHLVKLLGHLLPLTKCRCIFSLSNTLHVCNLVAPVFGNLRSRTFQNSVFYSWLLLEQYKPLLFESWHHC